MVVGLGLRHSPANEACAMHDTSSAVSPSVVNRRALAALLTSQCCWKYAAYTAFGFFWRLFSCCKAKSRISFILASGSSSYTSEAVADMASSGSSSMVNCGTCDPNV